MQVRAARNTLFGPHPQCKRCRTDPEKLAAVQNWPTPANVHEPRGFLGLGGFIGNLCGILPYLPGH